MSTPEYPGSPETPPHEPTVPVPPTHHPYGAVPPQPGTPPPPGVPPFPPAPSAYYGQQAWAPAPPNDGTSIAAFVLGIIGLVGMCAYGFSLFLSPVALGLGRSSMKRIDDSQGQLGGRGFAQAGFIMGIIGTVLLVLTVLVIGFFVTMFATDCFGHPVDC